MLLDGDTSGALEWLSVGCVDGQSAIEETLQRIESAPRVTGFVIMDEEGNVLRYRRDMTEETAKILAESMNLLTQRAMHCVRDLDPKVCFRV